MPGISKIIIANRGEIAVRIMRTCKELGIRTVAVFSDADRRSLHVRMADEAFPIGPPAAARSYLSIQRLVETALRSGADAVHPGYGFLSENADFAEACCEAGLTFIGPPASAIRAMGDKTRARLLMRRHGVPVVPGSEDAVEDIDEALRQSGQVGYPVVIKAAAGGGGKGMRIVDRSSNLAAAMRLAQAEAAAAFGDARVFIERYVSEPRHIEFQVLADGHGNMVHMFERECSIQRRHQKVVEEAPSCLLTPEKRAEMGAAALRAAAACGYTNAGTVEFLVDPSQNYYFMEMNTRLQVEHPVTEWVTGRDIVAEQIRIAEGKELSFGQDVLELYGHAIECRVYAEDPSTGFLPDPGILLRHAPPSGYGVRVDSGIEEGGEVSLHYDPLISKVTAWGRSRREAIRRMDRALAEYAIAGVRTTIPICRHVVGHAAFLRGDLSTHFVEEHVDLTAFWQPDNAAARAAAVAAVLAREPGQNTQKQESSPVSRWRRRGRW